MSSSQSSDTGAQVSSRYLLTMVGRLTDLVCCSNTTSSHHSMAHVLPRERLWRANFVEVKAPVLPRVCIRGRDVVIIPFNQVEN